MMCAFSSLRGVKLGSSGLCSLMYLGIGLLCDQVDLLGCEMFLFIEDWLLVGDGCGSCGGG